MELDLGALLSSDSIPTSRWHFLGTTVAQREARLCGPSRFHYVASDAFQYIYKAIGTDCQEFGSKILTIC